MEEGEIGAETERIKDDMIKEVSKEPKGQSVSKDVMTEESSRMPQGTREAYPNLRHVVGVEKLNLILEGISRELSMEGEKGEFETEMNWSPAKKARQKKEYRRVGS